MAWRLARWLKDEEEEVLVLLQVERLPSFLTFHMDVPSIRQGPHLTQQQVGWGTRLAIDRWCFLILIFHGELC